MCQTHYKQDCKFGAVREIKRVRPRRKSAVRLGGLSLSPEAADRVSEVAAARGVTPNHQLTDILEEWAQAVNRAATKRRGPFQKAD
ncbi:MAG TPA: hypothetical protein VK447_13700 [Myxococcaceae bacterium]|nr:hypothetical protein [Myxococcaceae bacterium]